MKGKTNTKPKTARKKAYRKKSSYGPHTLTKYAGIPNKLVTVVKYSTSITLGSGLAPVGSHTFRANSIFDPDFTSTGHQPMYTDQFATLYQNYKVLKTKIVAKGMGTQGAANANCCFGVDVLDSDSTIDTNADTIRERKGSKYRTITPQMPQTIISYWNLKKSKVADEDGYTALTSTNPTNVDFIRVYAFSFDGGTSLTLNSVSVQVDLYYTVEYFNPIMIVGS